MKAIVLDFFGVIYGRDGINQQLLEDLETCDQVAVILSNVSRQGIMGRVGHDFEGRFARMFLSGETNRFKPDPSAYEQVLDYLFPFKPEEVLFIDDQLENVTAAQAQGMQAIQYYGQTLKELLAVAEKGSGQIDA